MILEDSGISMDCVGGRDGDNTEPFDPPTHALIRFNLTSYQVSQSYDGRLDKDSKTYCPMCTMFGVLTRNYNNALEKLEQKFKFRLEDLERMNEWWKKTEAVNAALGEEKG